LAEGLFSSSATQTIVTANAWFDTGWKYGSNGAASYYQMGNGTHNWWVAPSGVANATATFTQALNIRADGTLWASNDTRPINGMTQSTVSMVGASAVDFSSIPSWARRITIELNGAATNTSGGYFELRVIAGGAPVTTGYGALSMWFGNSGQGGIQASDGFRLLPNDTSSPGGGPDTGGSKYMLTNVPGTNTWMCAAGNNPITSAGNGYFSSCHGRVVLASVLQGIRITTTAGTFASGQLVVTWE
jgi:hypothetical protein